MKKYILFAFIFSIFSTINAQVANRLLVSQNFLQDISPDNFVYTVPPIDNRFFVANINSLRLKTYNITGIKDTIRSVGDIRYKNINYIPSSLEITNSLGFLPLSSESDPVWTGVAMNYRTKAQNDLLYEAVFSKNTAFNKNFGSVSGTIAEGNDSRIVNGQTAFSWGNHALAGYITASSTNTLTNKSGNISQWTNDSAYLTGITSSQINTALGYTPYNGTTNPNGFLTSFTEIDPTVPSYSKTLNAFSVIKASTDPLYKSISYAPSSLEITTALGFTPYNSSNPNGYISSVPAQSFASLTGKPTTLSGYGITDAYPLTGNPSGFLTSFTEVDPNVPAYSKTLTAFSVIKSSTDPLYRPITYVPSWSEITSKPTTLSGFGITDGVTTTALTSGLAGKENTITAGTISQYWRGDKTWQTLDKTAVGLGNIDNTSDFNKPISTATQTALNAKQATLVSGTNIKTVGGVSILGSGDIIVGTGTVTSITAGTGLSGGTITTTGTISLPNTGTAGTYNTVTTDAQGRVVSGFSATPTVVTRPINSTSFQVSTTQASRVKYTVTHTIGLTLVLSSGSSMAYLEISPNNSTWTLVDQAGLSRSLAVAVVVNDSMTNNISAEVPAGYYVRIRTVTSEGGSVSYTCGQETVY